MDIKQTKTMVLRVADLHPNEGQLEGIGVSANPRIITDEEYRKLVKSLREDDLTGVLQEKVIRHNGEWIVLDGNMRLRALREVGIEEVQCLVVPEDADAKTIEKIIILSNSTFGQWDMDALANWDAPLADWGVELPHFDELTTDEEIERKEAEFRERMEAGEISEEDEEYQEFLDKFKLKKTTDDCYTPAIVYDAVADYVEKTYGVIKAKFVRPFYPGGDYQNEKYEKGCVVVDNPPFSILAEILQFYKERKIDFFLFAPALTLFSSSSSSCALCCGVSITYENGASVNTSFLTSFGADKTRLCSCPELYATVKEANDKNLEQIRKQLPKYEYPLEVVTSTKVSQYSRLGIAFEVPKNESVAISRLDEQKERGDAAIYGKGYLISREVLAERERAERERAERERAERERAERERAERERAERWNLSEREKKIVDSLGKQHA